MIARQSNWIRTRRGLLCPVCNHARPSGCIISADGQAVICIRVESERRMRLGWLHKIGGDTRQTLRYVPPPPPRTRAAPVDWSKVASECCAALPDMDDLPDTLGVSAESLGLLMYGWSVEHGCYTFPMRDERGSIIGIRTRYRNGSKYSMRGSRNGLFIPTNFDAAKEVWICEGPTDCAALLTLGLNAIGRPSNTSGHEMMMSVLSRGRDHVYIVADRESAERTDAITVNAARRIAGESRRRCRIIRPPDCKDVRDWIASGANAGILRWHGNMTS